MRVFIYEHTCAITPAQAPELAALRQEGRAMLTAIVEDFSRLSGVMVHTLERADEQAFRREAAAADWTLIIAPEFADILATYCRWVEESGGRMCGPPSTAVSLASDKLALAGYWRQRNLPTPPCRLLLPGAVPPSIFCPAVYKPRYGAGSQATFHVREPADFDAALKQAQEEGFRGEMLLQPFVLGRPASVAWLCGPRQ